MMSERHPDDGELHYLLFENYALNRTYGDSIQELERALTLYGYSETAANTQRAFAAHGYEEALRQFAKDLERLHVTKQVFVPVNLADVYATLGNRDRAFYWLEQAYSHRNMIALGEPLDYILVDPMLDALRTDPRYKNLIRRMGLPECGSPGRRISPLLNRRGRLSYSAWAPSITVTLLLPEFAT